MSTSRHFILLLLTAIILLGTSGIACRAGYSKQSPKHLERDNVMISLNVKCERSDYIPGGDVGLDVLIKNGGTSAVEIVDLHNPSNGELEYVIAGPSIAETTFTQRSATAESGATMSDEESFPPVTIDAGSTFVTSVSLSEVADLFGIGEYHVRLRLTLPGADVVESKECMFRVGAIRVSAVHVGLGVSDNWGEGEGALIERGELHTFEFRESAPEIAEADVGEVIHRVSVGNATDVAIPMRNTPFFDELIRWVVWLDGSTVKALTSLETTPASVMLPTEPACLIKPPLKRKGGPVEVLVLARDRKSVALARFEMVATAESNSVRQATGLLGWTAPLPAEARAITAAIGPAVRGSERHIVLAANTANGIEIFHTRYGDTGLVSPFVGVRVERKPSRSGTDSRLEMAEDADITYLPDAVEPGHIPRLLDGATPGIHVDERGDAWASFLAIAGKSALWIEARFPSGDAVPPKLRVSDLAPLDEGMPTEGAVIYVGDPTSAILRREVVLQLNGSRLARWDGKALVSVHVHGEVANPLLMVPGEVVTYLLYVDEVRGPHLEPLR